MPPWPIKSSAGGKALCRRPRLAIRLLGADFLVPAAEQALALLGRAVFGEVIVDQLDLRELRRGFGDRRTLIRRNLERVGLCAQRLRFWSQCPVVPLLGILQVRRALDDAHGADFE